MASGTAVPNALVDGFQVAFLVGAVIAAVGVVASIVLVRGRDLESVPEAEPVTAAA